VSGGPVESFLAELARHLRRDDATRRRVVAEVGDHLRDLVAEGRSKGLDEHTAESEAVARFGSARDFARGIRPARRRRRSLRAGGTLTAAAVIGGAFAFAHLHGSTAQVTPVGSATAVVATSRADTCLNAILANRAMQMLQTTLVHQTDAVNHDNQMLLEVGTKVELDPRTGRIVACRPVGVRPGRGSVWLLVTNPSGPFG
jgi:hypothetical protein